MSRIENPYIVGTPIPGSSYFYGRESLLKFVRDTLNPPRQRVVVLYGQRRIGKTSVLLELQRRLATDYHPVYFDLMGQANRPLNLALYDIAEQIADTVGLDLPYEFREPRQFRSFLDSVFLRLGNRPLLLLLDEFDDLSDDDFITPNAAALNLFDYLRDLLNVDLPIGFVFVVGRRLTELPQNFQSILKQAPSRKVGYLREADARELIIDPAKDDLAYSEGSIKSIINLTSGHPYFLQLICFELYRMHSQTPNKEMTAQDVEWVIDSAIETGQGGLSWFWDALPPAERFVMSAIAEAGGDSGAATTEAFNRVLEKHKLNFLGLEVTNAPALLVKWEILNQTSTGYRFSVDLVRRWVRSEHPVSKALLDVEDIIPRAKRYFENAIDAHRSGDINQAIIDYTQAISANPNHFRANLGLAQAYEELDDLANALTFYQQAYELDPEIARPSLAKVNEKLAHQYEQSGKLNEALSKFERAIEVQESPTRQIHLDEVRHALESQRSRRELWYRRLRYGLVGVAALTILILLLMRALPYLSNFIEGNDQMNAIPTAEHGEVQIVISNFATDDLTGLSPEAELEVGLSQAFDDVMVRRETVATRMSYEEAVSAAESSNSAAVIVGSYSSTQIEASMVFQNGVRFEFDRGRQFAAYEGLTAVDVEAFVALVIEEIETYELLRLAEAIADEDDGLTGFLSGRVLLFNQEAFDEAGHYFVKAIQSGTFEAPITWQPSLGIDVIYVPSGNFERGRTFDEMVDLCERYLDGCEAVVQNSEPVGDVYTSHFLMDAYEVTNAHYSTCVDAGACDEPDLKSSSERDVYYGNPVYAHYPVVYVSWRSARSYCDWRNGRLPTEAEWEKVARWDPLEGTLTYPWGNDNPDADLANFDTNNSDTVAVGQYEPSPLGGYDMAGNVWEWVQDWYQPSYTTDTENPQGPTEQTGLRVYRGGSHYSAAFGMTIIDPALHTGHDPSSGNPVTGFRCAYDDIPK